MAEKDYHPFRRTHVSLLPLAVGLVFFAASLTPSLIPRDWILQGALAGLVTGIGYMAGRFALTLWRLIELPLPRGRLAAAGNAAVVIPAAGLALWNLTRAAEWQNSVRVRVGMEATDSAHTLRVLALAAIIFLIALVAGDLVRRLYDLLRNRLDIVMRRRTANTLGLLVVALLLLIATRDWIMPTALELADDSYEAAQELFTPNRPPPARKRPSVMPAAGAGRASPLPARCPRRCAITTPNATTSPACSVPRAAVGRGKCR